MAPRHPQPLKALSVKVLKRQCRDRGIHPLGCLEKKDYVDYLDRFLDAFQLWDDSSLLRDYSALRKDTFDALNKVRANPKLLLPTLERELQSFKASDGTTRTARRVEISPGVFAQQGSHEGVAAVHEAIAHVKKQRPVGQLEYSYVWLYGWGSAH